MASCLTGRALADAHRSSRSSVRMPFVTLRVTPAPHHLRKRTQSVQNRMPTQSVGTISSWICARDYNNLSSVIGNSRIRLPVAW
ncbi:hypothetical protein PSYTB_23960 [Pseudomonas amygdali pv. tabaci str. ATCC 11528]|nr:hypothetical protein PSYTB_23960 [Pseudomonas amygdali pv. tabaci str. ATCC 11528]